MLSLRLSRACLGKNSSRIQIGSQNRPFCVLKLTRRPDFDARSSSPLPSPARRLATAAAAAAASATAASSRRADSAEAVSSSVCLRACKEPRFGFFELSLCLPRACLGKLIMCRFILSSTGVAKASSSYLRLDALLQLHHPAENYVSQVFLCQSRACLGNVSGLGRKWRFENKSRRLLTAPRGVRRCSRSSRLRRAASLNDAPSFYSRSLARRRPPLLQRQRWPAQLWRAAPPAPPQQPRRSQPRSGVALRLSNVRRRPALPRGAPRARLAAPPLLRDRPRPQRYPPSVAAALTAARPHWRRPVASGCCCWLRRWWRRRLLRERRAGQQWSCSSWASSCRPWAAYPSRCGEAAAAGCSLAAWLHGRAPAAGPRPARAWPPAVHAAACRRHVSSCLVLTHSNHSRRQCACLECAMPK